MDNLINNYTDFKMNPGTCLLCFSVTKVFNIKYTHLQNVYEELSGIEIQADPHPLCYICYTKLLQSQQLLKQIQDNSRASQPDVRPLVQLSMAANYAWSLPQNSAKIQLHPVTIKEENIKEEYVEGTAAAVEFVESPGRGSKSPDFKEEYYVEGTAVEFVESPGRESKSPAIKEECAESPSHYEAESTGESAYEHIPTKPTQDDTKHYACNVCNNTFISIRLLKIHHKQIHLKLKPYKCGICSKGFCLKNLLNRHILIHANEKPYSCDVCSKSFHQKCILNKHILTHATEKPYICDVCNKTFKRKGNLKDHIVIHSIERPYSCDVCSKTFRHKSAFNKHIPLHASEKHVYCCDVCSESFYREGVLNRHIPIHSNENPYNCDVCGRTLQKGYLKTYIPVHSCDVCSKSFLRKGDLNSHKLMHTYWKDL